MTDHTITAHDFYSSLPIDVLMRIRSSHITNLELMNEILEDKVGELTESGEGFFLETEDGESIFVGETVDEALEFITNM